MKCLRCGYCCKNYSVVIVDDPEKGLSEDNVVWKAGDGPGKYSCAIHHYPWFKETPCFDHTQIEQGNTNCRMGEYILKMEKNNDR